MKRFSRIIALLCAFILILSSSACIDVKPDIPENTQENGGNDTKLTDAPGYRKPLSEEDIAIVFGGMSFRTGIDVTDVIEALGDEYVYKESVSCIRPGMEKTYEFDGLVIQTVPLGDKDIVCLYRISGGDFTTPRGVGAGTTETEAIYSYESPWLFDGTYYYHSLTDDPNDIDSDRIQILIENGYVIEINIYSPNAGL